MSLKLDIKGLDKLQYAIHNFPAYMKKAFQGASKESYDELVARTPGLKKYPPKASLTRASVYGQPFVSDRQRRWFFAALKRGELELPYRRGGGSSERLGSNWYYRGTQTGGIFGNRASYAPFVHGEEQSKFMGALGWRRLVDVAEEKMPKVTAIYQKWIDAFLRKLTGG